MGLHSNIDTVAVASGGVYTKYYGSGYPASIAISYASRGLINTGLTAVAEFLKGRIVFDTNGRPYLGLTEKIILRL